jgi:peroxiredoxin
VGISVDDMEDTRELARDLELPFPLVSDPGLKLIRAYGVEDPANEIAWPAIYIVVDGKVTWRHVVENYKQRPTLPDVLSEVSLARGNDG